MSLPAAQRRSRRWGIFFKLLTFGYLFALLFMIRAPFGEGVGATVGSHTALVEVNGPIAADELASAIALNWLVLVAVHVNNSFFQLDGNGVVSPTNGRGNHAVHCDDLRISDRGEYQFDHGGSWGTTYGQQGKGWLTWDRHFKSTIGYHEFAAVRSVRRDTQGEQIPQ